MGKELTAGEEISSLFNGIHDLALEIGGVKDEVIKPVMLHDAKMPFAEGEDSLDLSAFGGGDNHGVGEAEVKVIVLG